MTEKLIFKKMDGTIINDVNQYVKDWAANNPFGTVTIGCDSQEFARYVKYAIVIVMHAKDKYNVGHGAHVINCTLFDKDIKAKRVAPKPAGDSKDFDTSKLHHKLWQEVELTIQAAQMLEGCNKKVKIHLDYNSDAHEMSNVLYASGIGYAQGMGYEACGKPWSWAATHTADALCR
jgi:predicted RNase H-related nuclease YkuK (DUF458 family)